MNIIIEPDARNYIMKKNKDKAITVTIARRPGGCCGGGCELQLPSVRLGIDPEKVQIYPKAVVEGINVYYVGDVAQRFKTVSVKLEKLLFLKKLIAAGK
ncbi:hypothetical protein EV210_10642 [Anaerospora hongkongensis]|uniref:Fe-S cluster assembly iron-binding protein IscA n=1 Tax=Anaerospora hongkongensis TaxID=244830 RepID=A0A4R1PYJ4_9FIRM|nr:CC/Se motif family (seleno)protein [Anaerospora hongkongensis]TCL37177.1 hypothetical protein EV210_10642 [Anaerospora hongkongensis]